MLRARADGADAGRVSQHYYRDHIQSAAADEAGQGVYGSLLLYGGREDGHDRDRSQVSWHQYIIN